MTTPLYKQIKAEQEKHLKDYREKAPHGLDPDRIKKAHARFLAEKVENAKKAGDAGYFRVR